jgi:ATP-binding cassette subfamily B protein
MARQGAYWRLYEAQARRVDADGNELPALPITPHEVRA